MSVCKVLVVDDEKYLTCMLAMKLADRGAQVLTASNGDDAFELATTELPQLVLTDFQMTGMNGLDLSLRLRDDPRTAHIPVLMLTARGHVIPSNVLHKTSIRQVIPKPFSAKELLQTIADYCPSLEEADPQSQAA